MSLAFALSHAAVRVAGSSDDEGFALRAAELETVMGRGLRFAEVCCQGSDGIFVAWVPMPTAIPGLVQCRCRVALREACQHGIVCSAVCLCRSFL